MITITEHLVVLLGLESLKEKQVNEKNRLELINNSTKTEAMAKALASALGLQ